MYAIDSQTQGYASSVPITTSCSGQSSLTRSRNQPARSAAPFDKTRAGSLHVQPNLRASSVPGSLLCVVLNLRDSSRRSGYCPFCPSGCFLLLTSRAYRASQVVRNVTAELRPKRRKLKSSVFAWGVPQVGPRRSPALSVVSARLFCQRRARQPSRHTSHWPAIPNDWHDPWGRC